jgi:DNA-binding IclR family transcriptional regulator
MSDNKQTAATNYHCESQQRGLAVMLALAGHEFDGVSLTEIATALAQRSGKPASSYKNNVFRDLQNLKAAGLAEQLPDSERWRLGPKMPQIAQAYTRNLARISGRFEELQQRYSREP